MQNDKRLTYGIVMDAIRSVGIDRVRSEIYGDEQTTRNGFTNEGVALAMFINTRQARAKITDRLNDFRK